MIKARNIMTRNVFWLTQGQSLELAFDLMQRFDFRHLPVVDSVMRPIGIVSEIDIIKNSDLRGEAIKIPDLKVGEVMTKNPVTCTSSCPVGNIVATMIACRISCVPITLYQRLHGIITTTDILDMFCRMEESDGHDLMPLDFKERRTVGSTV